MEIQKTQPSRLKRIGILILAAFVATLVCLIVTAGIRCHYLGQKGIGGICGGKLTNKQTTTIPPLVSKNIDKRNSKSLNKLPSK